MQLEGHAQLAALVWPPTGHFDSCPKTLRLTCGHFRKLVEHSWIVRLLLVLTDAQTYILGQKLAWLDPHLPTHRRRSMVP